MSYQDGWAALHLEMPPRVPRTEFSAEMHWDLVNAVIGSSVSWQSSQEEQLQASAKFIKAWNYDFVWSTLINEQHLHGRKTDMGHAVYAAGGVDRREPKESPFKDVEDVYTFDPEEEYGVFSRQELIKMFEEAYAVNCSRYPEAVNCSGVYITMFSGFIAVFGWEMLLLAAGYNARRFGEVAKRWERWISQFFEAFAETDIPIFMCHDDITWTSGAVMPPAWYREFIFPAYRRLWQPLRDAGKIVLFTSDGNYTEFVDDIAAAGANGFVMEPMTDMEYVAERYGKTHVFMGNADTRILLSGTKEQIRQEVERCMRIGKKCPGFFMAVGNHIPPNTPVENALYYNEVYEELSRR